MTEAIINAEEVRQSILKNKIMESLLDGETKNKILDKLRNDDYHIGNKYTIEMGKKIINNIFDGIKAEHEERMPYLKAELTVKLNDLYKRCLHDKKYGIARECIESAAKINGLYSTENNVNILNSDGALTVSFGFNDNTLALDNED